MERFLRTERLIGVEALRRLNNSLVTVIGLGAVGGYAVEGLARAGIGNLRLVDFDIVQKHNINRQIYALETTIGQKKMQLAKERVLAINPSCKVESLDLFADQETIPEILDPQPDILVDAIDSLNSKLRLLETAYKNKIEVISSMGAALRTDTNHIHTADLMDSWKCPLAKRIRKKLRRREVGRGITCVYSTEDIVFDYVEPEDEQPEDFTESERGRERRVLGSLPTITGIFGLTIANIAIQKLREKV
ncbi:MAG: tRNA threonylcarbamoyladenosine dehydratase [Magnetococcales bacterium]|nr:tRNA threonylcarbamoyladenosine dehydratase [Magnetococcales bacterium]